jgi:murein DD-endopeptidase MepM/ murein hydrolase activator NlpD
MQLTALANGAEQVQAAWVRVWPVPGACPGTVLRGYHPTTSPFAARDNAHPTVPHSGIDKSAVDSTPVYSATSGVVTWAEDAKTAGIAVIVKGSDGVQSRYYHLNRAVVQQDSTVNANDLLGYSGHSGHVESTTGGNGAHLHFEQWGPGAPRWIDKKNHSVSEYYIEPCTW